MKYIYSMLAILLFSAVSMAQNYMSTLTYDISVPYGDSKNFIENPSYLGVTFDTRKFIMPSLSVGASIGWQVLYQKTSELIELENGHVSGTQFRHINSVPIMLNSHLYLGGSNCSECFLPYVGLNAGGYLVWQRFEMGIFSLEDQHWQWGIAPELGFTVKLSDFHVNISSKLHYGIPAGSSSMFDEAPALNYISFNLGFAYYRR